MADIAPAQSCRKQRKSRQEERDGDTVKPTRKKTSDADARCSHVAGQNPMFVGEGSRGKENIPEK